MVAMQGYDYIIVGAGTSGCVLANRLSANPSIRVLLLEAGGNDWHPYIHLPVGFAKMTTGPFTWGLTTTPQQHANNREIPYAQARVMGGGSSINAEVFTRGNPSDYDRWAHTENCEGWAFDDIKEYFLKSEGNSVLSGDWHGADGPQGVSNIPDPQPMTQAFVKSCQEFGIPYSADFNGPVQAGAGVYQTTTKNGRRCSVARGYLKPVLSRPNLTVESGVLVEKVIVQDGSATGVEYVTKGDRRRVMADLEVLLTSGAIGTPKLMMLSGMGPAKQLQGHNINIVADLPGVGENLNDHFGIDIVAELNGPYSLDKYNKPHWALWAGLQYLLFRSGPVTSNVVEGGAFWFSDPTDDIPDLQFHFLAAAGAEAGVPSVPRGASGITLNSYTLRPRSRGSVKLRSARPEDLPIVDPNFLAHPDDIKTSVEGIKISRDIFAQQSLQKYIKTIHFPDDSVQSDSDYEAYARQYGRTSYHPTCTCKMGTDDMAVVDPHLRVRGVSKLRICDSSIMPSVVGSNTNAATIMIAEKAADLIMAEQ